MTKPTAKTDILLHFSKIGHKRFGYYLSVTSIYPIGKEHGEDMVKMLRPFLKEGVTITHTQSPSSFDSDYSSRFAIDYSSLNSIELKASLHELLTQYRSTVAKELSDVKPRELADYSNSCQATWSSGIPIEMTVANITDSIIRSVALRLLRKDKSW